MRDAFYATPEMQLIQFSFRLREAAEQQCRCRHIRTKRDLLSFISRETAAFLASFSERPAVQRMQAQDLSLLLQPFLVDAARRYRLFEVV